MRKKTTQILKFLANRKFLIFFIAAIGLIFVFANQINFVSAKSTNAKIAKTIIKQHFSPVCGIAANGWGNCNAQVVTKDIKGNPLVNNTSPLSTSYGPDEFHGAYEIPCTPGGSTQAICNSPVSFGGQTIAIVDAYNAPNIESDLNTYSSYYGLPQCTKANGCLNIVNEFGNSSLPITTNSGWALETSLDVEVAHMICQTCRILLVEANSSSFLDLGNAVNTAAKLGATEISNSYGAGEWSGEAQYDTYYNHPGIAVTVSTGDNGYGVEYPGSSSNVLAVGGTTLQVNNDNSYSNETVWSGSGSGCSRYENANLWQENLPNWSQTKCGTKRAIADLSADADPNTGAAVYDTTAYLGSKGWFQVGGTSLASPLIAGIYALAGGVSDNANSGQVPYENFSNSSTHDVTNGSNGNCNTIMCKAGLGYDGPTGLGSPEGISLFSLGSINTPTPTPTSTPTPSDAPKPTPSSTPTPTPTPGSETPTPTPTPSDTPTPTSTPTPTPGSQTLTFGNDTIGNFTNFTSANYINGSRFETADKNGTLKSIAVYVTSIDNSPYNKFQVAIYSDSNGKPGSLIANSATGILISGWNTQSVPAPLTANTYYWLVYNTNSSNSFRNNILFTSTLGHIGSRSSAHISFGTWPQNFSTNLNGNEFSAFATYTTP